MPENQNQPLPRLFSDPTLEASIRESIHAKVKEHGKNWAGKAHAAFLAKCAAEAFGFAQDSPEAKRFQTWLGEDKKGRVNASQYAQAHKMRASASSEEPEY